MPPSENEDPEKPSDIALAVQSVARIVTTLIETFGWPGALVIFVFSFVMLYATVDQKQRIIELYILGTGIAGKWPLIIQSALFVLTVLAQHRWYTKRLKSFMGELEREGAVKSTLQEKLTGKKLKHANSKTKPRGK